MCIVLLYQIFMSFKLQKISYFSIFCSNVKIFVKIPPAIKVGSSLNVKFSPKTNMQNSSETKLSNLKLFIAWLLYITIKGLWKVLMSPKMSSYWSFVDIRTSYKQIFICADNFEQNISNRVNDAKVDMTRYFW